MSWLEEMLEHGYSKMQIILVGNKCDLGDRRQVDREEGADFARKNNLIFFETSAKNAENVEETFKHASQAILRNI